MTNYVIPAPKRGVHSRGRGWARFRCAGFSASVATMPPTRSRWATTRTAKLPFFFQKNANNLDPSGEFPYPDKTSDVHHEVELVVALKSGGTNIPLDKALDHVWGYAVCLDMTRRDLQSEAKKLGRPWEIGKAFERSAPVGPLHPVSEIGHLSQGRIELKVNGDVRQEGDLNQMIWKVPEMISYLSDYFELAPGDIIMSGTPSGVGAGGEGRFDGGKHRRARNADGQGCLSPSRLRDKAPGSGSGTCNRPFSARYCMTHWLAARDSVYHRAQCGTHLEHL